MGSAASLQEGIVPEDGHREHVNGGCSDLDSTDGGLSASLVMKGATHHRFS